MLQAAEAGRGGAGEDPAAVTHREVMSQQQWSRGLHWGKTILLIYSVLFLKS